jgi:hypothetical protein
MQHIKKNVDRKRVRVTYVYTCSYYSMNCWSLLFLDFVINSNVVPRSMLHFEDLPSFAFRLIVITSIACDNTSSENTKVYLYLIFISVRYYQHFINIPISVFS